MRQNALYVCKYFMYTRLDEDKTTQQMFSLFLSTYVRFADTARVLKTRLRISRNDRSRCFERGSRLQNAYFISSLTSPPHRSQSSLPGLKFPVVVQAEPTFESDGYPSPSRTTAEFLLTRRVYEQESMTIFALELCPCQPPLTVEHQCFGVI